MEKIFANQRFGSVLPLTVWKNSIENKIVDLKKYAAFIMILPLKLWKWLAFLLHSVWVVFKLFFHGREEDAISVSSTRSHIISDDLIQKWQNTTCGVSFESSCVLPGMWYSALLPLGSSAAQSVC